jgi:hypothetical protein
MGQRDFNHSPSSDGFSGLPATQLGSAAGGFPPVRSLDATTDAIVHNVSRYSGPVLLIAAIVSLGTLFV